MKNAAVLRIGTAVLVLATTRIAHANPVFGPDVYGISMGNAGIAGMLFGAILVEYLTLNWLVGAWFGRWRLLRFFLLVNGVTVLITELLSFIVSWLAELVPLIAEPALYRRKAREVGVQVPQLGWRVFGANIVSFILGIVLMLGFARVIPPGP